MPRFDLMRLAIDSIANRYKSNKKRFNAMMHWCDQHTEYNYKNNALNYAHAMGYLS